MGAYSVTQIKKNIRPTNEKKLDKSIFSMLFLKTFKDAKFIVDGTIQPVYTLDLPRVAFIDQRWTWVGSMHGLGWLG